MKIRNKFAVSLLLLITHWTSNPSAWADDKPLWEAGVGLAGLFNPHYLGADQNDAYVLPIPYVIYRGKTVRADRGGLRGYLYDSERLDLRLSLGGSLPVNSDDNDAREGMDDLDLMLEVGPTLQYQIFRSDKHLLRADWPVRGAFTVGNNFLYHQGWTSNPRLHYVTDVGQWTMTTTVGPVFSDRRYHGYIYSVDAKDVRADRPFYQANSGYTGSRFSVGGKRRFGKYYVGAHLRYYDLDGAANDDSPLVKQDDYFAVSFIFAYVFSESDTLVSD